MTKTKRHMQPTKNMKTTNAAKRTLEVEHENYIKRREGHFARINYETAKQKLIILEENNYEHVFVLKTHDNWYKILGHSALIFLYFVWPEAAKQNKSLKKPPRLNADTDFRYKSPIGVLFNDNLSVFETPLLDVGAKKVKVSGDGGENVIAYKLAKAVPEQEFWDVKEREELEWSKANVIITPKAAYPVLAVDIQELAKTIFFVTRSMPTVNRDYFGVDMLFLSKRLATSLIMAERGHGSFEEFFEIAPGLVSELFANISLISVFRLVDQKVLIRLTDALMKIEKDLKSARADYVKRRSEATKD